MSWQEVMIISICILIVLWQLFEFLKWHVRYLRVSKEIDNVMQQLYNQESVDIQKTIDVLNDISKHNGVDNVPSATKNQKFQII